MKKEREFDPKLQKNPEEICIPENWSITDNNQRSLLLRETAVILFATDKELKFLLRSKAVLAYGTFKTASHPFMRIYLIFWDS